jgi:hypothetical protein
LFALEIRPLSTPSSASRAGAFAFLFEGPFV